LEDFIYVYNESTDDIKIPDNLGSYVEDVQFSPPAYLSFSDHDSAPPDIDDEDYYYLNMPNNPELENPLRHVLNVPDSYTIVDPIDPGITESFDLNGEGITVAILENGFFEHRYFLQEDMDFRMPELVNEQDWFTTLLLFFSSTSTTSDTMGHGTVVASNVLSVAPKATCKVVNRVAFDVFDLWLDTYASLDQAVSLDVVDIISVSWEMCSFNPFTDIEAGMRQFLIHAEARNITVLWCTGNENPLYPNPTRGSDRESVISVGGAYPLKEDVFDPENSAHWTASTYARSGTSDDFPDRFTPDVCGVVGQADQGGRLIMTPVGLAIDIIASLGGDKTSTTDGWAVLSGTSSATPQVAGAVALMLQVNQTLTSKDLISGRQILTPAEIKRILCETATEVNSGQSASGHDASVPRDHLASVDTSSTHEPNIATGYGVINVKKAIEQTFDYSIVPSVPWSVS
jgi:subtilisin family serine protease